MSLASVAVHASVSRSAAPLTPLPTPHGHARFASHRPDDINTTALATSKRSLTGDAMVLGYSSVQQFRYSVRHTLGITAGEFKHSYTGLRMLERFRTDLILPYREALCGLRLATCHVTC